MVSNPVLTTLPHLPRLIYFDLKASGKISSLPDRRLNPP